MKKKKLSYSKDRKKEVEQMYKVLNVQRLNHEKERKDFRRFIRKIYVSNNRGVKQIQL